VRFQALKSRRIRNLLPFGIELQRFAREHVGAFSEKTEFGFQDGGCLMFAASLRIWSNESLNLAAIYENLKPLQAQHVTAVFGEVGNKMSLYLDSDGAGTAEDLLEKMRILEGLTDMWVDAYSMNNETIIPYRSDLVEDLVKRLHRRFGTFAPDRLGLAPIAPYPLFSCRENPII